MKGKNLSVSAVMLAVMLSSCYSDNFENKSYVSDNSGSVLSKNQTSDMANDPALESTDEFKLLNDKGIITLIEDDIIWNNFLHDNYSFSENYVPKQIEYNNETYIEMALVNTPDMESVVKSLYIESDKNSGAGGCPFTSIADMKRHMQNVYTDNKIDEIISHSDIIEYGNSLYDTDSGKVYEERIPKKISIASQTDEQIVFSIYYESPYNDISFTIDYNVVLTESGWRLESAVSPAE